MAATSSPATYQLSRLVTAKACLRSWIRGRHDAERGVIPQRLASPAKVSWMLECSRRVPRLETNSAGPGRWGQRWSRILRYRARAAVAVGCSGTSRDLPNLVLRT